MKTCVLLLLLLLASATARAQPYTKTELKCTPGETKTVDCNTCTCSQAGSFACTEKACSPAKSACQYGQAFIDQCENRCTCEPGGGYACTEKGCYDGTPGQPMKCEVDGEIRVVETTRLFCKRGIVRFESTDPASLCTPGTSWQEDCNTCFCSSTGVVGCTLMGCDTQDQGQFSCAETEAGCGTDQEPPILGSGGSGKHRPDISVKRYCDGPCPADCGEVLDESRQCYSCQCLPELQFGDVVVPINGPCPDGLREGPALFATKICRGQGCTSDSTWKGHHDGCSTCVCTKDGEPACTPCQRVATKSTVTCEDGFPECPQDCGQAYNVEKDCYECPCGVGQPGDTTIGFDQPCPPGTDFREAGAFFKACGPLDTLPKGDTKLCDTLECPADCGTVRVSRQENCAYCQCGPKLAPGDEVVPIYEECRPPQLPGPFQLTTKVCRAPTRQECLPETTYNLKCDICICQDNGVPACTLRNCSLPKYGDLQVCDAVYQQCPADCGTAGSDSYCQFCQCGPRLEEGDITIPIDQECPTGLVIKETQFVTKTCTPDPDTGVKRYCDGPCPADCGQVLDESRQCYSCQCGPELQLGDVVVDVQSPCPDGLREGQTLFATKVCRGQGCTPDATWKVHHDGCSTCVCTKDGEPACTPCQRVATKATVTCDDGQPECPADCGQVYSPGRDCYECPCGVGQPGDTTVGLDEPCPPGTDFREAGAFFKACGPLDTLPKGDTKFCDTLECPADCGTVRISRQENCAYCQCGPKLAPGDKVVQIYEECRPPQLPGPFQLTTKVCRAPTRQECLPETIYNLNCDICICQENGVPACTIRDCSLPKYGDVQVCDGQNSECPADCRTAGSDSYCRFCQCGPRLEERDITIPIDQECPTGLFVKETQFITKTCTPDTKDGHSGYPDAGAEQSSSEEEQSTGHYGRRGSSSDSSSDSSSSEEDDD